MEMAQKENQKIKETEKGQQELILPYFSNHSMLSYLFLIIKKPFNV